jgi:hypothetical protein
LDAAAVRLLPLIGRIVASVVAIAAAAFLILLLVAKSRQQVAWSEILNAARVALQITSFSGAAVLLLLGVPITLVATIRMWPQIQAVRKPWWIRLNPNNLVVAPHLLTSAGLVQRRRVILGIALSLVAALLAVLGFVLEGLDTSAT